MLLRNVTKSVGGCANVYPTRSGGTDVGNRHSRSQPCQARAHHSRRRVLCSCHLVVVHAPALIFLRWRIAGKHIEHCLRRYQVSCREQALDASLANVADAAQHG